MILGEAESYSYTSARVYLGITLGHIMRKSVLAYANISGQISSFAA